MIIKIEGNTQDVYKAINVSNLIQKHILDNGCSFELFTNEQISLMHMQIHDLITNQSYLFTDKTLSEEEMLKTYNDCISYLQTKEAELEFHKELEKYTYLLIKKFMKKHYHDNTDYDYDALHEGDDDYEY